MKRVLNLLKKDPALPRFDSAQRDRQGTNCAKILVFSIEEAYLLAGSPPEIRGSQRG
jgi:hypothetical protein